MFCVRCGKPNRDEASYCAHCGAGMVQSLPPAAIATPATATGSRLWMAGVAVMLVLAGALASLAVCAWAVSQSYGEGQVMVDGKIVVGADGDPIELIQNSQATDVSWEELR